MKVDPGAVVLVVVCALAIAAGVAYLVGWLFLALEAIGRSL